MDRQKEKDEYFRLLYSLNKVSDDEDEAVEQRESLQKALQLKPPPSSSSSTPLTMQQTPETRRQELQPRKKLPNFRRTTSAPDSSVVKETPPLPRTKSLIRYSDVDTSIQFFNDDSVVAETPVEKLQPKKRLPGTGILHAISAPESSVIKETPPLPRKTSLLRFSDTSIPLVAKTSILNASMVEETPVERPPERSLSTPNIGSVVMKNSTGIASMLNNKNNIKKRKRRETKIKLVPKKQRIFDGQIFFFIPNDEVAPPRRDRIAAARNYGATWAEEWIPTITHVIVDKDLNYNHAMDFLRPLMKADTLPAHVILVNEEYPVHCIRLRACLDAHQKIYAVKRETMECEELEILQQNSIESDKSLQLKEAAKPRKGDDIPEQHTPPRSPIESQHSVHNYESPGVWSPGDASKQQQIMGSPVGDLSVTKAPGFVRYGDELDELIELALQVKHLPLDVDDDEADDSALSGNASEESGSSDEERSEARKAKKQRTGRKGISKKGNYACMQGSAASLDSNPNKRTIEILLEMADHYAKIREEWKPQAYRKAVQTLKRESRKISTYDEAIVLPNVGHRLAAKIEEIVRTDRLQRLESAKSDPSDQILSAFMKIYGVGHDQASRWIQAGYKTLDDLRSCANLTVNQRLGIDHYDDFNTKIPRDQVTALGEIVKKAIAKIDPDVNAMIMGSYRRGDAQSGDIDLLLTKAGTTSSDDLIPTLNRLTDTLTKDNFLVAALAKPHQGKSKSGAGPKYGSKWHGACVLPGNPTWRRIDFLLVPETEMGAALIYFTGDDIFNRSIRLLSSHKRMRLNQRGLYKDVMRGPGRGKLNEGTLVEGADEKKIFSILGVPWRPPEQRVIR